MKMNKSPAHPKYELGDNRACVFDPHLDFSQFLEEAKQHANQVQSPYHRAGAGEAKTIRLGDDKRNKKSWKSSLLSWWKTNKKSKPHVQPAENSRHISISNATRDIVSGPIYGSGRAIERKPRGPTSGPLTSLFNPKKRVEVEMPYACLDHNPRRSKNEVPYGPVYLVT